jgi:tetraacyldisaccharide 4'-kinase
MPSVASLLNRIWYGNSPLRWALWPISAVYLALARLRRTAYRRGWRASVEPAVPVIVVGNVSVGGTGKTPFVIWLAAQLSERGRKVGIVTRGYRGKGTVWPQAVTADSDAGEVGDEPVLLARRTGPTTACSTTGWRAPSKSQWSTVRAAWVTGSACPRGRCASRRRASRKSTRSS